jgi:hypothetical protein
MQSRLRHTQEPAKESPGLMERRAGMQVEIGQAKGEGVPLATLSL